MPTPPGLRFLVNPRDMRSTRIDAAPDAARALPEGALRLRVERFALTSNNITYAAFGDTLKYWQFFPTGEAGWGGIPAWGFAEVVDSHVDEVPVGERLFGFLPMASHLVVQPERIRAAGFVDGSAHRRELPPVYSQLLRCTADPLYHAPLEGAQAVLRPLFTTAFLLDDFLAEQQAFGAWRVVLSSASSKTACATAFCLAQRRGSAGALQVVGLTSERRRDFTASLGLYDEVLGYDELAALDPRIPVVYVDFAGDAGLRQRVHAHWAGRLVYSCAVGGTHWQQLAADEAPPGPRPVFFFAPGRVVRRSAPPPEGWGQEGLQLRIAQAWTAFVKWATLGNPPPLRVVQARGAEALTRAYFMLLAGEVDPREGWVFSL